MMEIIIDWMQFTSKNDNPTYIINDILGLDIKNFIELERGKMGYKRQYYFDGIFILFDGNQKKGQEMGTHAILTGNGCRSYESKQNLIDLIYRINENDIKATRIDIAIDDKEGHTILIDRISEDINSGNTVSKWKSTTSIIEKDLKTTEVTGHTIYLGKRVSEVFMRIYNKSLELKEDGNWIRMELEVKGEKAVELLKIIKKDSMGDTVKQIINNYFRIVEPSKDKNKARWKNKEYWDEIINVTGKLQLSVKREERTLEEMKNWIEGQVSTTLATIYHADGGTFQFLHEQVREGTQKIKDKHREIIEKETGRRNV